MLAGLEDIKKLVKEDKIRAISIDTSSFGKPGEEFLEGGVFRKMDQFNGTRISFVLSEIVYMELFTHMKEGASATAETLKTAIRAAQKPWQIDRKSREEKIRQVIGEKTPEEFAKERLERFIKLSQCKIIKIKGKNASVIFNRYWTTKAPFEAGENKKNEFPDAFAIDSLQEWAKSQNTIILVVTKDRGWKTYCDELSNLISIENLIDAFTVFNQDEEVLTNRFSIYFGAIGRDKLKELIQDAISNQLDQHPFEIEADSRFSLDEEIEDFEIVDMEIIEDISGVPRAEMVYKSEGKYSFKMETIVKVNIFGVFGCSVYDSVDKEYISMGSATATAEEELEIDVLVTVDDPMMGDAMNIDVEAVENYYQARFGEIEPEGFGDEE